MGESTELDQREAEWLAEQPEEEVPEDLNEEELQKREEERQKIAEQETEEATTIPKRKNYRIYIYGSNFTKAEQLNAKFTFEDKVTIT